jgi:hypothetical protein
MISRVSRYNQVYISHGNIPLEKTHYILFDLRLVEE